MVESVRLSIKNAVTSIARYLNNSNRGMFILKLSSAVFQSQLKISDCSSPSSFNAIRCGKRMKCPRIGLTVFYLSEYSFICQKIHTLASCDSWNFITRASLSFAVDTRSRVLRSVSQTRFASGRILHYRSPRPYVFTYLHTCIYVHMCVLLGDSILNFRYPVIFIIRNQKFPSESVDDYIFVRRL